MTTMSLALNDTGGADDQFRNGMTHARLEHAQGTPLHLLIARAGWIADYADLSYALGYSNTVAALQNEDAARADYDAVLAEYQRAANNADTRDLEDTHA